MSLPKLSGLVATVLYCVSASPENVNASDFAATNVQTNSPAPFLVSLRTSESAGGEPVRSILLTAGTNQFYLCIPHGFRLDASNPQKIVLINDDSCYLTFRIVGPMSPGTQELNPDVYRKELLQRYSGGKISSEFSRRVANHSGPVFDLQWKNSGGADQSQRITFIPSIAGVLEFSMMASSDGFSAGQYFFNSFLLGFRSNEGGPLEIVVPSGTN
jgi:hypothetical protein